MTASDDTKKTSEAMKKAAKILSRRMHSSAEIKEKLAKNFPPEIVQKTIAELTQLKFIDDSRFASAYAEELLAKGLGRKLIISKLARRGISHEISEKVLPLETITDEKARAQNFLHSKQKSIERISDQHKKKEKIFRILKSKGFSNNAIFDVIEKYSQINDNIDFFEKQYKQNTYE